MTAAEISIAESQSRNKRRSRLTLSRSCVIGAALIGTVLAVAIIGPVVAPQSPYDFVDAPFAAPASGLLLGADNVGRDVLSRVLFGGGWMLLLAAFATCLALVAGAFLGVLAGYAGGGVDELIMRILDVLLAFPQAVLALLFVSVLGTNFWLIGILVALIHMPAIARVIRACAVRVSREDYVAYSRSMGYGPLHIIIHEILPNITGPLLIESGLRFTYSIGLISGLSFLGLAQNPPAANWGLMINESRIGLLQNPWPVVVPVVLIATMTVGVNLLTDAYSRHLARVEANGQEKGIEENEPNEKERAGGE